MKPTKFLFAAALLASPALADSATDAATPAQTPTLNDTTTPIETGKKETSMHHKDMTATKDVSASSDYGQQMVDNSKFFSAAISFEPGSANLSDDSKMKLRQLVRDVRANRDIEQVTIAAWADKALPATGAKVVDADRDLADRRANAIRDIVRLELGVKDIDAYNMAEPANWLARTFNTKDAELKSVFGRTSDEVPVTREEFQLIKDSGSPGKAVVVAEYDHDLLYKSSDKPMITP